MSTPTFSSLNFGIYGNNDDRSFNYFVHHSGIESSEDWRWFIVLRSANYWGQKSAIKNTFWLPDAILQKKLEKNGIILIVFSRKFLVESFGATYNGLLSIQFCAVLMFLLAFAMVMPPTEVSEWGARQWWMFKVSICWYDTNS